MPKVTSKLQLTVPKAIADQYGICPGDELEWIPAGESIRVELMRRKAKNGIRLSPEERLELFDEGTKRLRNREQALLKGKPRPEAETSGRDGRERNFTTTIEAYHPDERMVRTAFRGMAAYRLSWLDAHLWAFAERYGLPELLSEDFEHGRRYGTVRVRNPFLNPGLG
jgi:bifunctional DNA-binding transcriptional regulator/antitoxin component of YhaV-PrlF toxin-antitoxin module